MKRWEQKVIRNMADWQNWRNCQTDCCVVMTNGCFDLLHFGHVMLLQTAKLFDSNIVLVVAVNGDESVRLLKGPTRPLIPQEQRLALVASLEAVDFCLLFHEKRCDQLILSLRPDLWIKGGDYTTDTLDVEERRAAEAVHADIEFIPYVKGISTTNILTRSQVTAARY